MLSHPGAYRAAAGSGVAVLKVVPHFAIYNRLNAWGGRRDIP
jgi:L-lactate dehydrogenase complex protein LldF